MLWLSYFQIILSYENLDLRSYGQLLSFFFKNRNETCLIFRTILKIFLHTARKRNFIREKQRTRHFV